MYVKNCQKFKVLAHEYRNMGSKLARTKEKHKILNAHNFILFHFDL